jgi:hypothetical protein
MDALNSRIGRDVEEVPVGYRERGGVITDTQAN